MGAAAFAGASVATAEPTDQTEALGTFLGGSVLAVDLDDIAEIRGAHAEHPSGDALDTNPLSADVLNAVIVELQDDLLLFPGNDLIALGAVNQYAAADAEGALAASGAVSDQGAISVGGSDEFPSNATVSLTPLLDETLADVVSQLDLELGALAASAAWPAGGEPTGDYLIADASLELESPAVGDIVTLVNDDVVPVINTAVSSLVGSDGELADALNALGALDPVLALLGADLEPTVAIGVDIPAALAPVLADSFGDEGVVINLAEGTVSVDLETILGEGSLNDLPPNTELLTDEALAAIAAGLAAALDDLTTELVDAVETALLAATLTLTVDASVANPVPVLPALLDLSIDLETTLGEIVAGTVPADDATIAISLSGIPLELPLGTLVNGLAGPLNSVLFGETGLVSTLAGTVNTEVLTPTLTALSPVFDGLNDVVSIVVNVQERPGDLPAHDPTGTESFTQRALTLTLLPGETPLAQVNLASATVRAVEADGTEVDGTEVDGTEVDGTEVDGTEVDGTEVDGTEVDGTEVDGTEVDGTEVDGTEVDGTEVDGTEVDGTEVDGTEVDGDDDGNESITADPDAVYPGDEVTVTGEDWPASSTVTVDLVDPDGNVVATVDVETDGQGNFTTTITVPEDAVPGDYTVEAWDDQDNYADDDLRVLSTDRVLKSAFEKPRVMRGAEQTFTAWGFQPGEQVQAVINSEPLTLPVRTADADGRVSWTFAVPADFEVGPHTGTATSVEVGDSTTSAFAVYVEVSSGSGGGSTGGGTGGSTGGGMLPRTGAEIMTYLALALLLVGTGTAAVVGVRRTRTAKG